MSNIVSLKKAEAAQTYDLEVAHPDHQFYLANGVLTSNSHAVSYAMDSYYCAWLLTHYEAEWLCAYLESMIGNPESRAEAIAAVKSFGYEIGRVDINESGRDWEISRTRKAFIPSFSTMKSVGSAAINEAMEMRPYTGLKEFLYNEEGEWRHSKFNKRAFEALIKLKGFESMGLVGPGREFSSYKHMYHCIIEKGPEIHKRKKKDPWLGWKNLQEIMNETHGMEEWTRREFAMFQKEIIGDVDPLGLMSEELKKKLEESEVHPIDSWENLDIYWFMTKACTEKKTKNGKPYLLLDVVGLSGKTMRMYLWDWDGKTTIEPYTICIGEVDKSDFGYSTKLRKIKTF